MLYPLVTEIRKRKTSRRSPEPGGVHRQRVSKEFNATEKGFEYHPVITNRC